MTEPHNLLIQRLPLALRERVLAACDCVPLEFAEVLSEPGQHTRHVYFPQNGFISLVTTVDAYPGVEVGMVGREGMLGVQLVLGVASAPLHALVQGAGSAWRMSGVALRREMAASPRLGAHLQRYVHVLMCQLAVSAACLRFHLIGARLARWLLMSQDRAQADEFRVTHEFLAYMLGVRREGITEAAGMLQKSGLIRYHRGALHVLDRGALERAACSCYAADQAAQAHLR